MGVKKMKRLIQIPNSDWSKNKQLAKIIDNYNSLKKDSDDLKKLFLLQKISYLLQKEESDPALMQWYNVSKQNLEEMGFEAHLQHYGIHRDASSLLQSIEFASAVRVATENIVLDESNANLNSLDFEKSDEPIPASTLFFNMLQERDLLFKGNEARTDLLSSYVENNKKIMAIYENDEPLQDKCLKNRHLLGLCYAKVDAIKGLAKGVIEKEQQFNDYKTQALGFSGCGLLKTTNDQIKITDALKNQLTSSSYILIGRDFYYYNKSKDKTKKISVDDTALKGIDALLKESDNNQINKLSEEQLSEIEKLTGHSVLEGNNKNFVLSIEDEEDLIIRVEDRDEDRDGLGHEQILQTLPVSEYFSQDYVTFKMPFLINGEIKYKPVIISEKASEGSLNQYAEKLATQNQTEIAKQSADLFSQMSDFSLKLIDSGFYHPDIKLSNFLTDGKRLIVSDRKTVIGYNKPRYDEISTTLAYAAPEWYENASEIDMPKYMAYQQGLALKEFMWISLGIDVNHWMLNDSNMSDAVRNLFILSQALTQDNPDDRLMIKDFKELLKDVTLPTQQFVEKFGSLLKLATDEDVASLSGILQTNPLTEELKKQLDMFEKKIRITLFFESSRRMASVQSLINNKVDAYLTQIDQRLFDADYEKSSLFRRVLFHLGIYPIAAVTTIDELTDLPEMDESIHFCLKMKSDALSNADSVSQNRCNELLIAYDSSHQSDQASLADVNEDELGYFSKSQEPKEVQNTEEPVMQKEDELSSFSKSQEAKEVQNKEEQEEEVDLFYTFRPVKVVKKEEPVMQKENVGANSDDVIAKQQQVKQQLQYMRSFEEPKLLKENIAKLQGVTNIGATITRGNSP